VSPTTNATKSHRRSASAPAAAPAGPASEGRPTGEASSVAPKKQPAFPWLSAAIPETVQKNFPAKFLAMHRREIHERASLLRRLGYSQAEVCRRLEGYELWEYEPFHHSPLRAEVAKLVAAVFAPPQPRTTTLSPGW
jgi:hypothetical protein